MTPFYKYHGAGNDFILIDDRYNKLMEGFTISRIARFCHRNYGIGADGLLFLRAYPELDFEMVYFNADGAPSTMCGNGGRCIARFAADLGLIDSSCIFMAADGVHRAEILEKGQVRLDMQDTGPVTSGAEPDSYCINTGSPHLVCPGTYPATLNVNQQGRAIRNSPAYRSLGVNVNFMQVEGPGQLSVATYERGVEAETLACGTGVVAAALVRATLKSLPVGEAFEYSVRTKGGQLGVSAEVAEQGFRNIWLTGPTNFVFKGEIE